MSEPILIPNNIQELRSYKPGKPIEQIAKELNLKEIAPLWNNENTLGPSPGVYEAIARAAENIHFYPDPLSTALREAIALENNCEPNQVVIDNGSESLLDNLFRSVFADGDELLTCQGTFVAVYIWAKANNREVAKIPLSKSYGFDVDRILDSVTPQTKAIYIANPNNPTGTIIERAELERLMDTVADHILLIIDEAYYEYAMTITDQYPDSFAYRRPNVITLRTFSKAYGLAGMRVGYALGPSRLIEAMTKVKMTFAPSCIAQAAALAALADKAHLKKVTQTNKFSLQQYYNALHESEVIYVPSHANFVMADLENEALASELVEMLMKRGVFIRQLQAFGLPHCVRITTGTEQETHMFTEAISEL
ncbi:MAG: histidinol-phosphate transaminase [Salibacteraceae bacterium]